MDVGPVLDTWRQVLTVDFLRYFLTAAPFYVVFWVWRPERLRGRRLQAVDPGRERILSELAYSLGTVVIFSAIGLSLVYAHRAGLTRIYLNVAERGWAYFGASVALAIVAHDAYFYWTHRLLHWRPLFRLAHHVHHRSTSPTPWAAYAFHPLEAVIQAGVYVVIVFAIPMHPLALMLFLVYMIVRNVVGHLGFEVWPAGFARHPLTRWHLTPTHHDLHHRFGKGNYGLYFSFWDDWAGTSRSDYREVHDAVTAPRPAARRTAAAVRVALCLLALVAAPRAARAADLSPEGRWTTVDDHTGEARSIVRVRIDNSVLRGQVERVLPRPGEDGDPVCTRCRGARHNLTCRVAASVGPPCPSMWRAAEAGRPSPRCEVRLPRDKGCSSRTADSRKCGTRDRTGSSWAPSRGRESATPGRARRTRVRSHRAWFRGRASGG